MRLYIKEETEKAYLFFSDFFKERWIPKKAVIIKEGSDRLGMYGISYEIEIQLWALK
jgi:hypothetical protein